MLQIIIQLPPLANLVGEVPCRSYRTEYVSIITNGNNKWKKTKFLISKFKVQKTISQRIYIFLKLEIQTSTCTFLVRMLFVIILSFGFNFKNIVIAKHIYDISKMGIIVDFSELMLYYTLNSPPSKSVLIRTNIIKC